MQAKTGTVNIKIEKSKHRYQEPKIDTLLRKQVIKEHFYENVKKPENDY